MSGGRMSEVAGRLRAAHRLINKVDLFSRLYLDRVVPMSGSGRAHGVHQASVQLVAAGHAGPATPVAAIPAPATSRELHPSNQRADRPLGMAALEAIAAGLAQVITHEHEALRRGEVRRTCILSTPAYDAWVVSLGPQTAIEPHDHDGSSGVIVVTDGRLIEFGIDGDGQRRSRLRHLVGGDATDVGITHRHSISNPDVVGATTVQVFSPPLGERSG